MRRAAVLGHPVSHSLSPVLHSAAYGALGLDWTYEAIDVDVPQFEGFLGDLGDEWAGLSLTMPLKTEAARLADFVEPQAKLVGPVNTLIPSGLGEYRHWVGANTDIHGITASFREAGVSRCGSALIIGGGATATSALAAFASIGATSLSVAVRDRTRAGALMRTANRLGVTVRILDIEKEETITALTRVDAVMSTIPVVAGSQLAVRLSDAEATTPGVLLDAVYAPVSTPLAESWVAAGGTFVSGVRMLLHQAGEQVRLMTGREAPLTVMDLALSRLLTPF